MTTNPTGWKAPFIVLPRQHQHRKATRAPHGSPEFTERIAFYATAKQKLAFKRRGGSQWVRDLIDAAMQKEPAR